jgi:hypothetical protein
MPRDEANNKYITLAIPLSSPLYQALLADSTASGRPLAAVALMRLADYYRGGQAVGPAPASSPAPVLPSTPPSLGSHARQASAPTARPTPREKQATIPAPEKPAEEEREPKYNPQAARANAAAALDTLDFF